MGKKHFLITCVSLLTYCLSALASPVSLQQAIAISNNVQTKGSNTTITKTIKSTVTEIGTSETGMIGVNLLYIVNYTEGGYGIIAADNSVVPILAYAYSGQFDTASIPPPMKLLLNNFKKTIAYSISASVKQTSEIKGQWKEALSSTKKRGTQTNVDPLIKTHWTQATGWNYYCPKTVYENTFKRDRAYVGCTPLAMAQIMNYYEYPKSGKGNKSYTSSRGFNCSANFEGTTYTYGNVVYNAGTPQEAKLCYHAGVAVNAQYDEIINGVTVGTTTYGPDVVVNALRDNFLYNQSVHCIYRSNYTDFTWTMLLRAELQAKRPIIYSGDNATTIGHTFIIDGVENENHFHVNWGWGRNYDAYIYLKDLNAVAVKSDYYDFSKNNYAIVGIAPSCAPAFYYDRDNFSISAIIENIAHTFTNSDYLSSNEKVKNEAYYQASNKVILRPGFSVSPGSVFRADNRGCIGPSSNSGSSSSSNPDPSENYILVGTDEFTDLIQNDPYWSLGYTGGLYAPNVIVIGGCVKSYKETTADKELVWQETGIIYPNPAKDYIEVTLPGDIDRVEIYNMLSEKKFELRNQSNSIKIDISSFPEGGYYMKTSSNGELNILKFTKVQ